MDYPNVHEMFSPHRAAEREMEAQEREREQRLTEQRERERVASRPYRHIRIVTE